MYAGTKVNWHEVLMARTSNTQADDALPLFLCAFSADKGSESIAEYSYSDFKTMYGGDANFFKYGQPLLQAHRILAAGGRVLGKRIVADDAVLGHIIIGATITQDTVQKTDRNGNPLYIDNITGEETIDPVDANQQPNEPAMANVARVKYNSYALDPEQGDDPATHFEQVEEKAAQLLEEDIYPLFVICDNGRGKSIKKVRISPDYLTSKRLNYMLYKIYSIEDTTNIETTRFAIYPDAVTTVNGVKKSYLLNKASMIQLDAESYTPGMDAYMAKLAEITGYTVDELYTIDPIFGRTLKGNPVDSIIVDYTSEDAINMDTEYGIGLKMGDNGSFGDAPFPGETATDAWANAAIAFFDGTFDAEIFDLDQHKIDFCVDANYPLSVKKAISDLADFREDFFFFRDMGTKIRSIEDIQDMVNDAFWTQSPFVGDYESTYEVIDPFSHKQVRVSMTYGLAPQLVQHYLTNVAAPIAGEFNNFVIADAIPNTLNFIPRVTPYVDQKEQLDNMKVNFVNYTSNGLLAIQSTYTSQDHNGPLSFSSNVIVTQMVIKAIRRYCPKIRFMLMDVGATDFGKYKTLIEDNVIDRYAQYFKSIELIYTRDDEQIVNKVFNASLYCYYRDFPQAEIFDVFAIEGSPDTNPVV